MKNINFDRVIQKLKEMDFQDAEILDLFCAVRLEWGARIYGEYIEVCEPINAENFLLRVRVRKGKMTGWTPGPACNSETLAEIFDLAKELKGPFEHAFILSRTLFSHVELKGSWRYEDKFQIVPCIHEIKVGTGYDWYNQGPPSSFTKDHHGPPYPFLLEVSVPKISNTWLQMQIGMKLLDTYENLICTFLKGVSGTILWPNDRQWIALKGKDHLGIDYHLLRSGIGLERGGKYDSWTEWKEKDAPTFDINNYDDSILIYQSGELSIREDLGYIFDKYLKLNAKLKRSLQRSTYFFSLAAKLSPNADLSMMNFSIAVECLLQNIETEICQHCGKNKKGPTVLFRDFLEKYAPVSESLAGRKRELYSIRSLIAHGSQSLVADFDIFSVARDRDTPMLMEWLVRKSIVSWLKAQ